MIEPLTDLACQTFEHCKIEHNLVLTQFTFNLHHNTIVVPMQSFAFSAIGNKMGGAKLEIATFHSYLAQNPLTYHAVILASSEYVLTLT
jgi:hypothetical protein